MQNPVDSFTDHRYLQQLPQGEPSHAGGGPSTVHQVQADHAPGDFAATHGEWAFTHGFVPGRAQYGFDNAEGSSTAGPSRHEAIGDDDYLCFLRDSEGEGDLSTIFAPNNP